MGKIIVHPKNRKYCVFCEYWAGDAGLEFVSRQSGYRFEQFCQGKCMMRNANYSSGYMGCPKFKYSREAEKLL